MLNEVFYILVLKYRSKQRKYCSIGLLCIAYYSHYAIKLPAVEFFTDCLGSIDMPYSSIQETCLQKINQACCSQGIRL